MAIMSLHWIWHLIGSERRSAAQPERHAPPLMKIEVERLPDYRWRDLGFSQVRRSDETDHARLGRHGVTFARDHKWLLSKNLVPFRSDRESPQIGDTAMQDAKLLTMSRSEVTPDHIMQIGMGFWASKALLSAVELGVFTYLGGSKTGRELERALDLNPRGTHDFLDALVALGLLARDGDGVAGRYRNTAETAVFLDRKSPRYIGGILEMANARLYRFWADLTPALRTGKPQNEIKHSGLPMFDELYADPKRLEQFMDAMAGISTANFAALAEKFDFSPYSTLADIGGASGQLSCSVASQHTHLSCRSCDLPVVKPIAEHNIRKHGLSERVQADVIDFLHDEFPKADIITMGMILHDWNLDRKKMLIAKAYRALPKGGALIAIENIIDDERRKNAFGLLMSLNMLIEFGDAFDFTGADFAGWCRDAGFARCEVRHLAGPTSAAIAYK